MWMRADELGIQKVALCLPSLWYDALPISRTIVNPMFAFFIKKIRHFYPQSVKRHINKNEILTTDIQYYNTLFNKHKDFY